MKDFHIVCNDHTIDSTTSVKYLGLNIDNLLSGEFVVNSIISKVNARLNFLYRQSHSLSAKPRKNLCSVLILCHLMYYERGNLILAFPVAIKRNAKKLLVVVINCKTKV